MRIIIESIDPTKRCAYDYDNLEKIYVDYQNRIVDDSRALAELGERFGSREVLLLGPGRTLTTCREMIEKYRKSRGVLTIGVNAVPTDIRCDAYFFSTPARYLYVHEVRGDLMRALPVILTSNIKREANQGEFIVNFNLLCKLGWKFFDNACIMALRLMAKLRAAKIAFAGFDGFPEDDTKSFYADKIAHPAVPLEKRIQINADICDMLRDFIESDRDRTEITFITPSRFASFGTSEREAGK